jgi:hypothetical protein
MAAIPQRFPQIRRKQNGPEWLRGLTSVFGGLPVAA